MYRGFRLKHLLVTASLISSALVSGVYAQTGTPNDQRSSSPERNVVREQALEVVNRFGSDNVGRDRALAALGWQKAEVVAVQDTILIGDGANEVNVPNQRGDSFHTLSSSSCGRVSPGNAYKQSNGSELYVGNFEWTCAGGYDSASRPEDAIGLWATDSNGNSLTGVQATNAYGWVEDTAGTRRDSYIYAHNFNGTAASYRLDDTWVNGQWIGKKGGVYFYLDKRPGNVGNHYLKMCWKHTWNNNSSTIKDITIGYPLTLTVTFSNSTNVLDWTPCQQVTLTYPNG